MRAALERWLLARWFGKPGLLWVLWPLTLLYRVAVAARRAGRNRARPPVPVIVVGNITVGGAGKTPLVLALVLAAQERGLRVGVVSRGHGGNGPFPLRVLADTPTVQCGDEPALIARRSGAVVVVDPDRPRALSVVLSAGVDLVISDDGLQHYALPRTVEMVVIDGRRGLGNGHCLPIGPLRELPARLRSVDFVIGNGGDAGVAALPMTLVPTCLRQVADPARSLGIAEFRAQFGSHVSACAGIGDPERFFTTLRRLDFVVDGFPFPDHHVYRQSDLAALAGRVVLMTEKDAVKCRGLVDIGAWYLEIEARLPAGLVDRVLARAGIGEKT